MRSQAILVVDDEWEIGELIVYLLTERGYQAHYAPSGLAALQKLADISVDLVLTDLMMPAMDGFELLEALGATEELASIPVLVVTALPEYVVRKKLPQLIRVLRKPFTSEQLLRSVREAMG